MLTTTLVFRVRVLDQPIDLPNGRLCERTVIVQEYRNNIVQHVYKYGWIDKEDLYTRIDNGEHIDLDYCYVKDFSLRQYRRRREIGDMEHVELKRFSAVNACFDSEAKTDFSYANFSGKPPSFTATIFANGNTSFYKTNFSAGNIDFSKVFFGVGYVDFQYASFDKGNVTFQKSHFDGESVSFVNTNFGEGNVNFKDVDFGKALVKFQFSKFEVGIKTFDKAKFGGPLVNFRRVEFGSGRLDFRRVQFGDGDIIFEEAVVDSGKVSFRSSHFGNGLKSFNNMQFGQGEVAFDQTDFGYGKLSFSKAKISTLSFKGALFDGYVDLRVEYGDRIDLSGSIVRDIIDLHPQAEDEPVKLRLLNISGMRNLGKLYIDWEANDVKHLINSQKHTSARQKANQFILIKEGFHQLGEYNWEDKAYVEFKRQEMRAWVQENRKKNKFSVWWIYPQAAMRWLLLDQIGLYATSPLRVFASMILSFIFFSLLFYVIIVSGGGDIVSSIGDPDQMIDMDRSFYHSAITFLTIGYGDFYPSGHIRWLSAVEGWVGLFQMSYFTVAFVRKILR